MPTGQSIKDQLSITGVTSGITNVASRVIYGIQGVEEPQLLREDAKNKDFDAIKETIDKNLDILQECLREAEE